MQQTVAGRHVEQRRRRHEHVLRGRCGRVGVGFEVAGGDGLGLGRGDAARHEREVEDVVHRPTVGELGALREAGGARGVEDGGVVVGVDGGVGQGGRGGGTVHHVGPAHGVGRQGAVGAHGDDVQRATGAHVVEHLLEALEALVVGDEHLGAAVGEAVLHLGGGPPGIHAHHGRADRHGCPVGRDPLGIVAHGDGHAVALDHAVGVAQQMGQRPYVGVDLGIGVVLVLVHHVRLVAVERGHLPQHPHAGRCRGEGLHGDAPDLDLLDLEGAPGAGEFLACSAVVVDHPAILAVGVCRSPHGRRGRATMARCATPPG